MAIASEILTILTDYTDKHQEVVDTQSDLSFQWLINLAVIEFILGNIGSASVSGGVTVDNTGIESRLGATTDPAADTGNGSLNALLKAVRDDVDSLNTFYGSLTNAGSSTGGVLERLRAISENTEAPTNTPTTEALTSAQLSSAIITLDGAKSISLRIIMSGFTGPTPVIARIYGASETTPTANELSQVDDQLFFVFATDNTKTIILDSCSGIDTLGSLQVAFDSLPVGASAELTAVVRS